MFAALGFEQRKHFICGDETAMNVVYSGERLDHGVQGLGECVAHQWIALREVCVEQFSRTG